MKYLFIATILLFSFCSFGQIPDSTWKVDTVQRVWRHAISRETIPYDKLSPAMRKFIDTLICKHIYVAVEQPEIKVEYPRSMKLAIFEAPKTGKHEGQEIVCVKCFHIRKQVIDYGEIDSTMLLTPNVRHRTPNDSLRNK